MAFSGGIREHPSPEDATWNRWEPYGMAMELKITGTVKGTVLAGVKILWTVFRYSRDRR